MAVANTECFPFNRGLNKCCESMSAYVVSGKPAGMGAPCFLTHICCKNCTKTTEGRSWWYTGYSDDEVLEKLVSLWNA